MATAIHNDLATHIALCGSYTHSSALGDDDASHLYVFNDPNAAVARALRQRHREIRRIGFAVTRNPDCALQVVGAHHRIKLARLLRRNFFNVNTKTFCQRDLLSQHLHALGRAGNVDAAALLPAGRKASFGFKCGVQLDAVLAHARHVAVGSHLADEPCRMPRRAAGQLALLQQQHVALTQLGQMVGRRTACDAAADDDNFRL